MHERDEHLPSEMYPRLNGWEDAYNDAIMTPTDRGDFSGDMGYRGRRKKRRKMNSWPASD